ncbi:putative protein phosphatase 2C [Trypanosoma conorhini]|uniref:protein-serine/threonine phosphatase n=1 Tax=Trypanosoma conorhini TaxID=83891 RepID=A0A3R7LDJ8_9TRYP|nr:putative protein phosphatase 2C [Trypanosoma conorhini]RNF26248.1 putative protein phosphatase 2C [Trypanosoma conorhini]
MDGGAALPGSGQFSQQKKGEVGDGRAGSPAARTCTPTLPRFLSPPSPPRCPQEQQDKCIGRRQYSPARSVKTPVEALSFKDRQLWRITRTPFHSGGSPATLRPFAGNVPGCFSPRQLSSPPLARPVEALDRLETRQPPRHFDAGGPDTAPPARPVDNAWRLSASLGSAESPRRGEASAVAGQNPPPAAVSMAQHVRTDSSRSKSSLDCTLTPRRVKMRQMQSKRSSTSNSRASSCGARRPLTPPSASRLLAGRPGFSPGAVACAGVSSGVARPSSLAATVPPPESGDGSQAGSSFRASCTATNLPLTQVMRGHATSGSPASTPDCTVHPSREYSSDQEKTEGALSGTRTPENVYSAATVGVSGGLEHRDHEKMLKRPKSFLSSPTRPLLGGSCPNSGKAALDGFLRTVQSVDERSSSSASASSTGTPEVSSGRQQPLETASTRAATRENKRQSSFSSLYFSMTKRHRMQRLMHIASQPAHMASEEATNREVRGEGSTADECPNADDEETSEAFGTVGILETEEHVFIPRYEVLPEGQTPMELMLNSIRLTGACGHGDSVSCRDKEEGRGSLDGRGGGQDVLGEPHDGDDEVFTFGGISPEYATSPTEEDPLVDCKVAARLCFDAENGVMLISPKEEVGKYISQTARVGASDGADEDEQSGCTCSMQFITKDIRGGDYSRYHAHALYHHCVYCNRRPAAFLCLHCLRSTCPSHVTQHYKECEAECTLFLNLLDIMTSFDRIFWCEKCRCFTWKYTEAYDALVDQLAVTRGTYLEEAVRDISCVGYEVCLRRPHHCRRHSSLHMSPPRDPLCCSLNASPKLQATTVLSVAVSPVQVPLSVAVSPMHQPLDAAHERPLSAVSLARGLERASPIFAVTGSLGCGSPVARRLRRESGNPLVQDDVLRVGEAVFKLVALGAKVQGWRTTQEDAEAAFVIDIPALSPDSPLQAYAAGAAAPARDAEEEEEEEEDAAPETIPMAIFCVFDGHGGDAVAKLAASNFESHLRKAVASARHDDVQARSLLFQLDFESSSPLFSPGEGSPVATRGSDCSPQAGHSEEERNTGVSKDDVVRDVTFTSEALRRHLEATNAGRVSPPLVPLPQSAAAAAVQRLPDSRAPVAPAPDVGGLGGSSADKLSPLSGLRLCGACPPVVSRQEMEMLRAYFAGIMEDALLSLDDGLRQSPEGARGDYQTTGCTACVVGITANFILCANVGDSGAAVYTDHTIRRISVTHRITDPVEAARITAAGYSISGERIEGLLAVTRALGDYDFKQCGGKGPKEQAVIAVPDVTIMPVPFLGDNARLGVVAACDGVWDTATLHQVHHAIVNTPNDLDVAGSAMDAVIHAREMAMALPHKEPTARDGANAGETALLDAQLLTSAAGVFAQCVAPCDNDEGIGLDNCSLFLIERRWR